MSNQKKLSVFLNTHYKDRHKNQKLYTKNKFHKKVIKPSQGGFTIVIEY